MPTLSYICILFPETEIQFNLIEEKHIGKENSQIVSILSSSLVITIMKTSGPEFC